MRVKITLQALEPQILDINYNYYLSALIYHLIGESDLDFSTRLHSEGYPLENKNFKLFCFSRLFMPKSPLNGDKITVSEKMNWYISSPIKEFLFHLGDGLLRRDMVNIGNAEFYISSAEMLRSPVFENEMIFKSISPITTHTVEEVEGERKTVSCLPSDPKFVENIKNNLIRKYFLVYGRLPRNMSIQLAVDENYLQDKGKLIKYKNTLIKGYQIPLKMSCDRDIMEIAYDCGVGEKNSAGFGCIDIWR